MRSFSPKRQYLTIGGILLLALAGGALLYSLIHHPVSHRPKILLATPPSALSAALFVAHEKGFFEKDGLEVEIMSTDSGKAALKKMLAGEVDIALVSEVPIVSAFQDDRDLTVFATIARTDRLIGIAARRDLGIEKPADLWGKVIAVPYGTNADLFLDIFLQQYNLTRDQVTVRYEEADALKESLAEGLADAICVWNTRISELKKAFGNQIVIFYGGKFYRSFWNLAARRDLLESRSGEIQSLLAGLKRGAEYLYTQDKEGLRIVADYTEMSPDELAPVLKAQDSRILLEQALISSLEDTARWGRRMAYLDSAGIPNYLALLSLDPLTKTDPEAVSVIR